jgi:FtsP/CotA-like multicopper oxidase with cupredoxin domain
MRLLATISIACGLLGRVALSAPALEAYKDELPIPPALVPESDDGHTRVYHITMRNGERQMHSQLPAKTPFWGYEGQYPGPTIDVPRDREVVVKFTNSLNPPSDPLDLRSQWPFFIPKDVTEGGVPHPVFVPKAPWTVIHLHGSPTRADHDGWADNAFFPGDSAYYFYPKQERAALLWYHDHGNMVTRLNVYAGLAGLYIVRDAATDALYPSGDHELPLVLQDRDFELTPDGSQFTGRFRYQALNLNAKFEPASNIFLVNGTVRPYKTVDRSKYRLRILNGANARFFRLAFRVDGGPPNTKTWEVIGVDGGLLTVPVSNPTTAMPTVADPGATKEMVVLGPAERLDVVVDFSQYPAGSNVELVHLRATGTELAKIMQFRVDAAAPPVEIVAEAVAEESVQEPRRSPRLASPYEAADSAEAAPGLESTESSGVRVRTIALYTKDGMQTINGLLFHDSVEEKPEIDSEEIWEFLNTTRDDHPMHLHLVNFEVVDRQAIQVNTAVLPNLNDFDGVFRTWLADPSPGKPRLPPGIEFVPGSVPVPADAYEKEPKDTVRVPKLTLTRMKVKFRLHTGLYMYHCHILEHEDMEMMRPLLVVPAGMPDMAHIDGHGDGGGHAPPHESDSEH